METKAGKFPAGPDELTADWLTGQLAAAGAIGPSARIAGFALTPLGAGSGFMGRLVRVELEYATADAGAPRTIVAKFAGAPGHHRDIGMQFRLYEREVRFYQQVAASFPGLAPSCHAAEIDPESGDSVLLLEDLGAYRTGDQLMGCSAREADMVLDALAPMHARFLGRIDELDWAPRIDGPIQVGGTSAGCAIAWDPLMERFGHCIAREIQERRDQYLAAIPEMHRWMARPEQTLVHGDIRLDNLMFGALPSHRPVVALDWIVTYSAPVQDLAYLLTHNLTLGERRLHETSLVTRYHKRLCEHGVESYPLERLWADYRVAVLFLFSYAVLIAGGLDPTNARGAMMMEQLVHRSSSAVMDHGLLAMLPKL